MNCRELLGSEDWAEDIQLIIMKDLQWLPLDRSFLAFVSLKSFTEGFCPWFLLIYSWVTMISRYLQVTFAVGSNPSCLVSALEKAEIGLFSSTPLLLGT